MRAVILQSHLETPTYHVLKTVIWFSYWSICCLIMSVSHTWFSFPLCFLIYSTCCLYFHHLNPSLSLALLHRHHSKLYFEFTFNKTFINVSLYILLLCFAFWFFLNPTHSIKDRLILTLLSGSGTECTLITCFQKYNFNMDCFCNNRTTVILSSSSKLVVFDPFSKARV